ncbi:FAD-dependent oxidoreductase [Streptomyces sp. NBC_00820]|uniref:NAD(P)/FAD-dependent oxidoreductase n=1 Tax=Streptomyces sp. NBC_00820 TaxID=2975842 RepID=UPI002ED332BD|nr:FAD-dependent oxidoreductase [Streptomyces sp. NBC_00820]
MTSDTRVVVIGAGLAGTRLARRLGELGTPALLVGEEAHPPYNRVLLADVLAGRYGPEVITLPSPGDLVRARITGIDRAARLLHRAGGPPIGYGTLVLATGSNPVLPPLHGLRGDDGRLPGGVHAFRTLDDCLDLAGAARPGARAVVVGGGLLGVSAARALAARGVRVVLAQQAERLMERRLDPDASALVRRHLTDLGIEVHTECRVRDVRRAGGAVRAVELADGYVLDTDLVVLACGVRPRTGLAERAGLAVREGVLVDDRLRTSDPRVHAIGDCARHAGTLYGLAAPALEQADVLAQFLAGDTGARYTGTRSLTRLTLSGPGPGSPLGLASSGPTPLDAGPLDLAAFGRAEARPGDDVVRLTDATRGTYRKLLVRHDRLVGGVLVGDLGAVGALARAWEGTEPLPADGGPLLHLLTLDGGS